MPGAPKEIVPAKDATFRPRLPLSAGLLGGLALIVVPN